MTFFKTGISLSIIALLGSTANAQNIDLNQKLNRELATLRDYKLSERCTTVCDLPGVVSPGGGCTPFFTSPTLPQSTADIIDADNSVTDSLYSISQFKRINRGGCCGYSTTCTPQNGKLTTTGLGDFTNAVFDFGDAVYDDLPDSAEVTKIRFNNCTDTPQRISKTLTLSSTARDSISLTNTVTKTKTQRIHVQFGFKFPIFSAGGGASYTVARAHSVSSNSSSSESSTVTRSTNISLTVPPKSSLVAEAIIYDLPASVPFTVQALANASISRNLEGISYASDVLSDAQRNLTLNGSIDAVAVSEIDVNTYQYDLACDDSNALTEESAAFSLDRTFFESLSTPPVLEAQQNLLDIIDPDDPICLTTQGCGVGSSCTATNDNGDATCSITCEVGQQAVCLDGTGSSVPSCECQ